MRAFLELRGANVHTVHLPHGENGGKVGLDDFLVAGHTVVELRSLAKEDQPVWGGLLRESSGRVDEGALPKIPVSPDVHGMVGAAEQALLDRPALGLYQRGGVLVRVIRHGARAIQGLRRSPGAPLIVPVTAPSLLDLLSVATRFVRVTDGESVWVLPPKEVVDVLLVRQEWSLPHLEGVVEYPVLLEDGRVLSTPGYDSKSGYLLNPTESFPDVPDAPREDEVTDALHLLAEPFEEFKSPDEACRAAILAAILTVVARPGIRGPVPMWGISASMAGTGKGLLADVITTMATGRAPSRTIWPRGKDAQSKLVLTLCLEGHPVVLLDNVEGGLGGDVLSSVLTAETWRDRVLGISKSASPPHRLVWLCTGNGLVFRGDSHRRVVPINLDAEVENPEDRRFRRPNLLEFVRQSWPRYCSAALTVLRAFVAAGRPLHGGARMGSFDAWDDLVRSAVIYALDCDPCAGRERLRKEAQGELAARRTLFAIWREAFPDERVVTAAEVVRRAGVQDEVGVALRDAVLGICENEKGEPRASALGYSLRSLRGAIAGGLVLETTGEDRRGNTLWRVKAGAAECRR